MARRVDHATRRREIAAKAMHLFSQVGYDNVSLIMIAQAAGVSRTAIYRYFCSKREVLDAAILEITGEISRKCAETIVGRGTIPEKLEAVCNEVADVMFANKEFLVAVFDFVIGMVRTGADMNRRIAEFTSGTRDAIRLLVEHGKRRGHFAEVMDVGRTTDAIYAEFESCAMRIVLGTEKTPDAAKVRIANVIRALSGRNAAEGASDMV